MIQRRWCRETRGAWLTILVLVAWVAELSEAVTSTNSNADIISVTPDRSCSAFSTQGQGPGLNCGADGSGTATVLELALPLGSDQPFSYEFMALMPRTQQTATGGTIPAEGQCSVRLPSTQEGGPGACLVAQRVRLSFQVSRILTTYELELLAELQVPHQYTGHFSPAYRRKDLTNLEGCGQSAQIQENLISNSDPNKEAISGTFQNILRLNNADTLYNDDLFCSFTESTQNMFNTPPLVYNGGPDADDTEGPFTGNGRSYDEYLSSGSPERNFQCGMCPLYTNDWMTLNANLYYDNLPGNNITADTHNRVTYVCPWSEGRTPWATPGTAANGDLSLGSQHCCEQGKFTCSDARKGNPKETSLQATYCGSQCRDKYGQLPTENFPARQWSGSLSVYGPLWKCQSGGLGADSGDTGVNKTCFEECRATKGCTDAYSRCMTGRPPLYDTCKNRDEWAATTTGPEIMYWYNPMCISCNIQMGVWPNAGGKSPIYNSPTRPTPGDPYPCAVDDDDCASSYVPPAPASGSGQGSDQPQVNIVECLPCGCVADYGDHAQDPGTTDPRVVCPGGPVADAPYECNTPYPDYPGVADIMPDPNNPQAYTPVVGSSGTGPSAFRIKDCNSPIPTSPEEKEHPVFVCKGGPKDRTPVMPLDNKLLGPAYSTAEFVGMLMPPCSMYRIVPNPQPIYVVLIDIEYPDDPSRPKETGIKLSNLPAYSSQGAQDGYVTNSDGTVLIRIDNLLQVGSIAPTLGGMIGICNATKPEVFYFPNGTVSGYANPTFDPPDLRAYNMAGDEVDEFGLPQQPWVNLMSADGGKSSVIFQFRANETANEDLVAGVPLPGVLKGLVPDIPDWSWWFYLDPADEATYGTGCGQVGMNPSQFADAGTAQQVCNGERHTCVPGMIPGYDLNVNQFWYDFDMSQEYLLNNGSTVFQLIMEQLSLNNGTYSRYLRDTQLKQHTPCVISSMFQDMVDPEVPGGINCAQFRQMNRQYRHLPPDWVPDLDRDDGKCYPPKYYLQKGLLMRDDVTLGTTNTQAQVRVELEVVVANSYLIQVDESVAPGVFVPDFGPTGACMVTQGSDEGRIPFEIQNTGQDGEVGSYLVEAECGSLGVTVSTTAELDNLQPGERRQGSVALTQSGLILPSQFTEAGGTIAKTDCTLVLRPLALPQLIEDTLAVECNVVLQNGPSVAGLGSLPVDGCKDLGACVVPPHDGDQPGNVSLFIIITLAVTVLICCCFFQGIYAYWNADLKRLAAQRDLHREQGVAQDVGLSKTGKK